VIVAAGLMLGTHAQAFCRKTTCQLTPTPPGCTENTGADYCPKEGLPLYWKTPCLSFSVQHDGSASSHISAGVLEQQVQTAYDTWMSVTCIGGGSPNLFVAAYPEANCGAVGYQERGPNQNLWVFRDTDWEKEIGDRGIIALTTLTVNETNGEILDADVELNSTNHVFTTDNQGVETDLLSVILHESGHVLGIDHAPGDLSTMSDSYNLGSIDKQTLEADDVDAICAIMPPGQLPEVCDPEPLGGFSTECAGQPHGGCCSVARGRVGSGTVGVFGVGLLVLLGLRRRTPKPRPER
jgi:hypothetical protein